MQKLYKNVAELVGKTPMFEFSELKKRLKLKGNIFGKCEFFNPFASIEDRTAVSLINKLKNKNISQDNILIEPTNADLGLAVAAISSSLKIKIMLVIPENENKAKIEAIKYLGADVILTPAEEGIKGAVLKAEMLAQKSDKVIILSSLEKQAEEEANLLNLSMEILESLNGEVDVIVGADKEGLKGIAKAIKTSNPELYVLEVKSDAKSSWNKAQNEEYKDCSINESQEIDDENAYGMAKAVAQKLGLPVGVKSGAVLAGAVELASRKEFRDKNIVAILPDIMENF